MHQKMLKRLRLPISTVFDLVTCSNLLVLTSWRRHRPVGSIGWVTNYSTGCTGSRWSIWSTCQRWWGRWSIRWHPSKKWVPTSKKYVTSL